MAWLKNWRLYVLFFLLAFSFFAIHPFTKEGLRVSLVSGPASGSIKVGDYILEINGIRISSLEDFERINSNISFGEGVTVKYMRETYPYIYKNFSYSYVTRGNGTGFYITEAKFSNLKFNYQLLGGYKIILSPINDTLEHVKYVVEKRLSASRISDYKVSIENGKVVVYTSEKDKVLPLLEKKGLIEAKIGDEVIFTSNDIIHSCISGVGCQRYTYLTYNITETSSTPIYKYGFEVIVDKEAARKFANVSSSLEIGSCKASVCYLSEPIKYYLDGIYVGEEEITAFHKGKEVNSFLIGGVSPLKSEAVSNLLLLQAFSFGSLNAKVENIEVVPPTFSNKAIMGLFLTIFIITFIGSSILAVTTNNWRVLFLSLSIAFVELFLVLGIYSWLNINITQTTFVILFILPIISIIYQNIFVRYLYKGGYSLKKSMELKRRVRYSLLALAGIFFIVTLFFPSLGAPFLVYFLITSLLTKTLFLNGIRKIVKNKMLT